MHWEVFSLEQKCSLPGAVPLKAEERPVEASGANL